MAQTTVYTTASAAETESAGRALCERLLAAGQPTAVEGRVRVLRVGHRLDAHRVAAVGDGEAGRLDEALGARSGDLGVGKTAFVRGFVSALAPGARVKSPTYTIVNEYRGGRIPVFHFDVYRIEGEDDLYSTGYYDYLDAGYLLCEWSEKIPFALPDDRITVEIAKTDGADGRRITLTLPDGAAL